ncbi:MAG: MGMT family protein [Bacteroidia bacterium]|nr:MGMT family protein [Bacteroidia bacterium]
MSKKKSWIEKRDQDLEPEIKFGPDNWNAAHGGNKMLIATPSVIDETIKKIPAGRLMTMTGLRETLAADHGADYTCPLTTGIFLRIAAEAAEEERSLGKTSPSPWWRVVRDDGAMNEKLPGHGPLQQQFLEEEGHRIVPKARGTTLVVQDFEPLLIQA